MTRIFTFASVHVKDFTFFLVLVRTVSKEIIILRFFSELDCVSTVIRNEHSTFKRQISWCWLSQIIATLGGTMSAFTVGFRDKTEVFVALM